MEVVSGVRFVPSEEELLNHLLLRVVGLPLPLGVEQLIWTADLYGEKEPWQMVSDEEEERHFFTPLKKVSAKKSRGLRYVRHVGSGTWTNKGQAKTIYCSATGKVKGYKRVYRYETRKKDVEIDGGAAQIWLLAEYTLPEQVIKNDKVRCKDYALCLLKKKKMKKKMKSKRDVDDDDVAVAEHIVVGDEMTTTTVLLPSPPPTGVAVEQIGRRDSLGNDDLMPLPPPPAAADLTGDDVAEHSAGCCWDDQNHNNKFAAVVDPDDDNVIGYWRDFLLDNDDELLPSPPRPANQILEGGWEMTSDDLIMSYFNSSDLDLSPSTFPISC